MCVPSHPVKANDFLYFNWITSFFENGQKEDNDHNQQHIQPSPKYTRSSWLWWSRAHLPKLSGCTSETRVAYCRELHHNKGVPTQLKGGLCSPRQRLNSGSPQSELKIGSETWNKRPRGTRAPSWAQRPCKEFELLPHSLPHLLRSEGPLEREGEQLGEGKAA